MIEDSLVPVVPPSAPERRLGRFYVDAAMVRKDWRLLLPLFEQLVVVRCEFIFSREAFLYEAFSEMFEPLEPEYDVPQYVIEVTSHRKNDEPDGAEWFSFAAVKEAA